MTEVRSKTGAPLLEVSGLSVRYEPKRYSPTDAVTDVSFTVRRGEFIGLIGESGSGKTTLGTALLRLLEKPGRISGGSIVFNGTDLTHLDEDDLRGMRWTEISTVFQSSMNSLNPVLKVEDQFTDVISYHTGRSGPEVDQRIDTLFDMVLIDRKFRRSYPHELSGGMRQRINLALALALEPEFVLLDEPTTGLDVVVQKSILDNIRALQTELGFSVLFISHDIGTVLDLSDRILVMYGGRIVEQQAAADMLADPLHPYTKGLLGSYADPRDETVAITYVPGRPPDLSAGYVGCAFAPRCPERIGVCERVEPPLLSIGRHAGEAACHVAERQRTTEAAGEGDEEVGAIVRGFAGPQFVKSAEEISVRTDRPVLLSVDAVSKTYRRRRGLTVTLTEAVKDASFQLRRGSVTALVGQSGSGKSTLAKIVTGVESPTAGSVTFHGDDGDVQVGEMRGRRLRDYRSHVQMVFQDPYSSLNPAKTLGYILRRPLANYRGLTGAAADEAVLKLLETVALTPADRYVNRFGYELSGGQRQRVVIARALAVEPELIIADEPVASLDVSIRAEILELLNGLVSDRGVTILYITHDLLSARMIADEVVVLNEGRVVEQGPALEVIRHPKDAYTRLLLDAVPNPTDASAAAR